MKNGKNDSKLEAHYKRICDLVNVKETCAKELHRQVAQLQKLQEEYGDDDGADLNAIANVRKKLEVAKNMASSEQSNVDKLKRKRDSLATLVSKSKDTPHPLNLEKLKITDHALLRLLERIYGFDTKHIREQFLEVLVDEDNIGKYEVKKSRGKVKSVKGLVKFKERDVRVVVKGNNVVTTYIE